MEDVMTKVIEEVEESVESWYAQFSAMLPETMVVGAMSGALIQSVFNVAEKRKAE